jgi:hypothetical protein
MDFCQYKLSSLLRSSAFSSERRGTLLGTVTVCDTFFAVLLLEPSVFVVAVFLSLFVACVLSFLTDFFLTAFAVGFALVDFTGCFFSAFAVDSRLAFGVAELLEVAFEIWRFFGVLFLGSLIRTLYIIRDSQTSVSTVIL